DLRAQIEVIDRPVVQAILAERRSQPPTAAPQPLASWDFARGLKDQAGALHGTAHGGAVVKDGRLRLDGQTGYVATAPLQRELKAKTLEAWVTLDNLTQRGGGVLGVQSLDGSVFDAIVFAEREAGRWLAGSDFFRRTQDFAAPQETEATGRLV